MDTGPQKVPAPTTTRHDSRVLHSRAGQKVQPLLAIGPESTLYRGAGNSHWLGEAKQADNDSKVYDYTDACGRKDTPKTGTMSENIHLQPHASSRGGDCADQLWPHGPDHKRRANAYRTAGVIDGGDRNEDARNDARSSDPRRAKGQACENRHDLDA